MLTPDEERTVEQILLEFARRGQSRAAETASILSRMPANPEAVEFLVSLARQRGLPWVEFLAETLHSMKIGAPAGAARPAPPCPSASGLAELLASDLPYPRKVDALLAAARAPSPELAELLRRRFPAETDPFVVATLASSLGQCGNAADGQLLRPLLVHPDSRVVANALEALRRLEVRVPAGELTAVLGSADNRVCMNALALLAAVDPARALQLVRAQISCPDPARRAGLGFLLGDLRGESGARALLIELMGNETQTLVLKQLARSLRQHVTPETTPELLEALGRFHQTAAGAKRSVLDALVLAIQASAAGEGIEEEDTDLTFSQVWGATARAREPTVKVPVLEEPPPPRRAGARWLGAAAAGMAALVGVMWLQPGTAPPADDVPASVALRRSAQPVKPKAVPVRLVASAPRPAPRGASGGGTGGGSGPAAVPVPASDLELPVVGKKGVKVPRHFGKVGIRIDVKGVVVGVNGGAPIIRSSGRHYLIVSGPVPEAIRAGDAFHLLGKLVGRSLEGLFYVDASRR